MTLSSFTAYKDSDGKLHTALEAAQKAERRIMFASAFDAAVAGNPQLARLDKALVVDFCMTLGKSIGDIANDRLTPAAERLPARAVEKSVPATPAEKSNRESASSEEKGGRFENASRFPNGGIVGPRAVGKLPELGMPYGGDSVAFAAAGGHADVDMGVDGTVDGIDLYSAMVAELSDMTPAEPGPIMNISAADMARQLGKENARMVEMRKGLIHNLDSETL